METNLGIDPRTWIDRLIQAASTHDGYNTADEESAVLKFLTDARAIFSDRAAR